MHLLMHPSIQRMAAARWININYQLSNVEVKEVVRMSDYTGPIELELMPLRLWIAVHSDAFTDIELVILSVAKCVCDSFISKNPQ